MSCSCCGADKATVALHERNDVELCRDCIESLAGRIGLTSTPTLPVTHIGGAKAFYESAGFAVRLHFEDTADDREGYAFVEYDGQSVFDLASAIDMDPTANRAGCYLVVEDADEWHARLSGAGLAVSQPFDEPWGMREFTWMDPSGNRIRIGHNVDEAPAGT